MESLHPRAAVAVHGGTGRVTQTWRGHTASIYSVCISHDGQYVVSGGADNSIRIWEMSTGKLIQTLTGHTALVRSVCLTSDDRYVISGSGDHSVKIWQWSTGTLAGTFTGHTSAVLSVDVSVDSQFLVSASQDNSINVWESSTGTLLRTWTDHDVYSMCLSYDGRYTVTGSWDKSIRIWEVSTGRLIRNLTGHTGYVCSLCVSGDGRYVVSGSEDKSIKIWDFNTGRLLQTLTGHTGYVYSVCLTSDSRYVISGSGDKSIKIWEMLSARLMQTLTGHWGNVHSVCVSPCHQYIISGSADTSIKVWNIDLIHMKTSETTSNSAVSCTEANDKHRTRVSPRHTEPDIISTQTSEEERLRIERKEAKLRERARHFAAMAIPSNCWRQLSTMLKKCKHQDRFLNTSTLDCCDRPCTDSSKVSLQDIFNSQTDKVITELEACAVRSTCPVKKLALAFALHKEGYHSDCIEWLQKYEESINLNHFIHPLYLLLKLRTHRKTPDSDLAWRECLSMFQSLSSAKIWMTDDEQKLCADSSKTNAALSHDVAKSVQVPKVDTPVLRWAQYKATKNAKSPSLDELMSLTGLTPVKSFALTLYETLQLDKLRDPAQRVSDTLNFIFSGNPGTGKTTVAKLFAGILKELGIRSGGAFVETSGSELISAGPSKFDSMLQSALGGVLFIDEAYQLDPKTNVEGRAIIDQLLLALEKYRTRLSVILAGYADDLHSKLISYNPGLDSRFPQQITFPDYTEHELAIIFQQFVTAHKWTLEADNLPVLAARLFAPKIGKKGFGNARNVRNLFERSTSRLNARMAAAALQPGSQLSSRLLSTLTKEDILGKPPSIEGSEAVAELNRMVGLTQVKAAMAGFVTLAAENYRRLENFEPLIEVSLNRLFLGPPGTGKTSVATIYGKLIGELGYLSKGGVQVRPASAFVGDVVGASAKKTNEIFDLCEGKVLVIDEAYALDDNMYGKQVLDTIVERVQEGCDFAVMMCGYSAPMQKMFRDQNPGLARRFRIEEAFTFEDYNDTELGRLFKDACERNQLPLSRAVIKTAVSVLAKQRQRPNFGNGGAVKSLFDTAMTRMVQRRLQHPNTAAELLVEDLTEPETGTITVDPLDELIAIPQIREHFASLAAQLQGRRARGIMDTSSLLRHYVFVGNPGTGKTTIARKMGTILHRLGLLATDHVEFVDNALSLQAPYLGQTPEKVHNVMQAARGGVLFIDEAYGLDPKNGLYAKQAVDTLLSDLTHPDYLGKMVVVLAGYASEMDDMLHANPGLRSRFTGRLSFPDWTTDAVVDYFKTRCAKDGIALPLTAECRLRDGVDVLRGRAQWANARDAVRLYESVCGYRDIRIGSSLGIEPALTYLVEDVEKAIAELVAQRPVIPSANAQLLVPVLPMADNAIADAPSQAPPLPKKMITSIEQTESTRGESQIDDGNADDFFASLEKAFSALGYDLYKIRDVLRSKEMPRDLLELLMQETGETETKIKAMVRPQYDQLLPRIEEAVRMAEEQAKEEERRRLAAITEQQKKEEAERLRRRRWICGACGNSNPDCPYRATQSGGYFVDA